MTELFVALTLILFVNMAVGLSRIMRGPTAADRMLAAEMISTNTVAIVLLLWAATGRSALIDVALVFSLLSALAVVTFVSRAWSASPSGGQGAGGRTP